MFLGAAFKTALNKLDPHAEVIDYGDPDEFKRLWANNAGSSSDFHGKSVVIVWDGREPKGTQEPDGDDSHWKLLSPHLTPLDWTLAYSIQALHAGTGEGVSIHIVDLTAGKFKDVSWAVQMRHQLLAEMPWMTLHAPLLPKSNGKLIRARVGYGSILGESPVGGMPALLEEVSTARSLIAHPSKLPKRDDEALSTLRGIAGHWSASLVRSDDHHDINNVIGPALLGVRTKNVLKAALVAKASLGGTSLVPWKAETAKNFPPQVLQRGCDILIVDDQLRQGWGEVLRRVVGAQVGQANTGAGVTDQSFASVGQAFSNNGLQVRLHGCLGPRPLNAFLKNADFGKRNFLKRVPVGQGAGAATGHVPQVIFLDLRLYSSVISARDDAQELLGIIKTKVAGGLAWPGFDANELEEIEKWCKDGVEGSRTRDKALLLLPRLLSLALPLCPIILFSSTGQPWVKEWLRPYRNIFTGFEKPRVLSNTDSLEAATTALHEALNKSLALNLTWARLAHAQKAIELAEHARPTKKSRLAGNEHIELYFDETGTLDEGIVSGAAICVFSNRGAAESLQTSLLVEFNKPNGIVWAKKQGALESQSPLLQKGYILCEQLGAGSPAPATQVKELSSLIAGAVNPEPLKLWCGVATKAPKAPVEPSREKKVALSEFPDGALDEVIRFNIEFTLFALLPYLSKGKGNHDISIFLPTRQIKLYKGNRPGNEAKLFAAGLSEAFNIDIPQNNRGDQFDGELVTFTAKSAFPLVRGWLQPWKAAFPDTIRSVTKIGTTTLGRGEKWGIRSPEADQRRLMHDFADWICSASVNRELLHLLKSNIVPNWYVSGPPYKKISPESSLNVRRLIEMLYASSFRKNEDASVHVLGLMLSIESIRDCIERFLSCPYDAQKRVILWTLKSELSGATGNDLMALIPAVDGYQGESDVSEDSRVSVDESEVESSLPVEDIANALASDTQTPTPPSVLEESQLAEHFSGSGVGEIYPFLREGPGGLIYFKLPSSNIRMPTHCVRSKELALWLKGYGFSRVKSVYAIANTADTPIDRGGEGYPTLRVLAAKLENGKWQMWRPEEV